MRGYGTRMAPADNGELKDLQRLGCFPCWPLVFEIIFIPFPSPLYTRLVGLVRGCVFQYNRVFATVDGVFSFLCLARHRGVGVEVWFASEARPGEQKKSREGWAYLRGMDLTAWRISLIALPL